MRKLFTVWTIVACAAVSQVGCATKLEFHSLEPGVVPVGSTQQLTILDGEGRRSARETVFQEVVNQCRALGYFSCADRSEEGHDVRVFSRRAEVDGELSLEDREAGVRLDVHEWTTFRDVKRVSFTDKAGVQHTREVPIRVGKVLLGVTLFNSEGMAYLSETEYEGQAVCETNNVSEEELLREAARNAVVRLLQDITPRQVLNVVRLDDDDPALESILKTATAGNVAQAAQDCRQFLESYPNHAGAAFNLAVFLDAMQQYDDAIEQYDRAMKLGSKPFYVEARSGCARRAAAMAQVGSAHFN